MALRSLPAATPLVTVLSTVDADFGKHFPKDWKAEDDQISLGKTILPGSQLSIPCGGATNKETGGENLLCWPGMALRQSELEDRPAHVKVLFNDGECYVFHRQQALVPLPVGGQFSGQSARSIGGHSGRMSV